MKKTNKEGEVTFINLPIYLCREGLLKGEPLASQTRIESTSSGRDLKLYRNPDSARIGCIRSVSLASAARPQTL